MSDIPEIAPQEAATDITAWLVAQSSDRDGYAGVTVHLTEDQARMFAYSSDRYEFNRCVAIVKVTIPRGLLVEKWQRADA